MFSDVLLTVDFDRTMTGTDGTIPQRNLDAIRYFIDHGGTFTVNTGRTVNTMRKRMDQIPVNAPFLLYNGSAAYDRFTVSLSTFLSFPVRGLKLLHRAECTAKEQDIRI